MTLAFYPFGALFAALFLGVAFTVFAVALHLLDRLPRAGASILPGLVSGIRDWSAERGEPRIAIPVSPASVQPESDDEPVIVDLV